MTLWWSQSGITRKMLLKVLRAHLLRSLRLAREAASTWCLLWSVPCNAYWLEALHALAAGWCTTCRFSSIRAGSLHGSVAIKCHSFVAGIACWAALTLLAREL